MQGWLQSFRIFCPYAPRFEEGGVGRAYILENHAVKFTTDKSEANIAAMCIGQDVPAKVISVLKIQEKCWSILSERYFPEKTPKSLKAAADAVVGWIDEYPDRKLPSRGFKTATKETLRIAKISDEPEEIELMFKVLLDLYRKTGFRHDDAGSTNIAIDRSGKLVVMDLGPNQDRSYNPDNCLDQIQKNRSKLGLNPFKEI